MQSFLGYTSFGSRGNIMIGVMQGRLLPKYLGRYQAHPLGYWQKEFYVAADLGLDCIEFILDFNDVEQNPLMSKQGVAEIQKVISETGVKVKTICVDYLMEAPLHSSDVIVADKSTEVLLNILNNAMPLGITDAVIPCVDQSSLNNKDAESQFVSIIKNISTEVAKLDVNLSLETDLAPTPFANLLSKIDRDVVKVNYDIGNSAALGFDPVEELDAYGHLISDIHIKDRVRNGGPCVLGTGNANFERFFKKLLEFNYQGPFIMQAFRDEEGVEIFKRQLDWIKPFLTQR